MRVVLPRGTPAEPASTPTPGPLPVVGTVAVGPVPGTIPGLMDRVDSCFLGWQLGFLSLPDTVVTKLSREGMDAPPETTAPKELGDKHVVNFGVASDEQAAPGSIDDLPGTPVGAIVPVE